MTAPVTDPVTDRLTVHRAVMLAAGPEALAEIVRPLTPTEYADVTAFIEVMQGMDDADLASYARVPESDAPYLRRLLTEDAR